jgi:hypothetical protein
MVKVAAQQIALPTPAPTQALKQRLLMAKNRSNQLTS